MKRFKLDHEFEVPSDMTLVERFGMYAIGANESGVFICGVNQHNLTTSPIYEARIIPLKRSLISKEIRDESRDIVGSIENVFDIPEDEVYYNVFYGERSDAVGLSFVFNDRVIALNFINMIVAYKAQALGAEK